MHCLLLVLLLASVVLYENEPKTYAFVSIIQQNNILSKDLTVLHIDVFSL